MKNVLKRIFKFKMLLIALYLMPIDVVYAYCESETDNDTDEEKKTGSNWNYYYLIPVVLVLGLAAFYYFDPFEFWKKPDPFDMSIQYKYPNDGEVRPPQNPKTVAQREYFVIPGKPYFVDGVRNFLLLDRDMIEYIVMPQDRPEGRSIPPYVTKWLEICYGYDITQDFFMNLEYHRKMTLPCYGIGRNVPYVDMEWVFYFVKGYYRRGDPYRVLFSVILEQQDYMYIKGKDFYDLRIFSGIYTRRNTWPVITC